MEDVLASDLVSIKQASIELDCTTQWVYKLISKGELHLRKDVGGQGGTDMLTRQEIERYKSTKKGNAAPASSSR
jgi:hypothetical protein